MSIRSLAFLPSERLWSTELLAMVAFLCLMTLVGLGSVSSVLFAVAASVALVGAVLAAPWRPSDVSAGRVTVGLTALVGVALALGAHTAVSLSRAFDGFSGQFGAPVLAAAVTTGVVSYLVYRTRVTTGVRWLATVLVLGVVVVTGVAYLVGVIDTSIDVFTFHHDAAAALAGGENPYVVVQGPTSRARSPSARPRGSSATRTHRLRSTPTHWRSG